MKAEGELVTFVFIYYQFYTDVSLDDSNNLQFLVDVDLVTFFMESWPLQIWKGE